MFRNISKVHEIHNVWVIIKNDSVLAISGMFFIVPVCLAIGRAFYGSRRRDVIELRGRCRNAPKCPTSAFPPEPQLHNDTRGYPRPICNEKHHRNFVIGDTPFTDYDNLPFGHPVVIAPRQIKTTKAFRSDGYSEIHIVVGTRRNSGTEHQQHGRQHYSFS